MNQILGWNPIFIPQFNQSHPSRMHSAVKSENRTADWAYLRTARAGDIHSGAAATGTDSDSHGLDER